MKPIFDPEFLSEWQKIDPQNWRTLCLDLIELFEVNVEKGRQEIEALMGEKNFSQLEASVHSMKSNFGNVGALKTHAFLSEIELLLHRGENQEAELRLKDRQTFFDEAVNEVRNFKFLLQAEIGSRVAS